MAAWWRVLASFNFESMVEYLMHTVTIVIRSYASLLISTREWRIKLACIAAMKMSLEEARFICKFYIIPYWVLHLSLVLITQQICLGPAWNLMLKQPWCPTITTSILASLLFNPQAWTTYGVQDSFPWNIFATIAAGLKDRLVHNKNVVFKKLRKLQSMLNKPLSY